MGRLNATGAASANDETAAAEVLLLRGSLEPRSYYFHYYCL